METKAFTMPSVMIGQTVYWYPDGDEHQEPHVAIVTKVAQETICVSIVGRNTYNLRIKDGVRHLKDPVARQVELRDQGAWDHTPFWREFQALRQQVHALANGKGK